MKIAGFEKCSCVDWPGRVSAVVFTPGCNLDCFYCHNRLLLGNPSSLDLLPPESVIDMLSQRRGFLDGVVISGGEPTIQDGLAAFIGQVRALGFPVKLDTNGSRPEVLQQLVQDGLLDYVAMDIKAPFEKLDRYCGAEGNGLAMASSIKLLLQGAVPYEFRTTVAPQLTKDDVVQMARWIAGAEHYVLQQFRAPDGVEDTDPRVTAPPHDPAWFSEVVSEIEGLVGDCHTRGLGEVTPKGRQVA
jgi:pyruvate formate lyase activating enzyme